jgi:hypothetical protein
MRQERLKRETQRERDGIYWSDDNVLTVTPEFEKLLIERSGKRRSDVFEAVTQTSHIWRATCSLFNDITKLKKRHPDEAQHP